MIEPDPFCSLETLRRACRGHWLVRQNNDQAPPVGASIDSREISAGQAFFAHRGERTDGHRFVGSALRAGASLAIVDRPDSLDADALECGPVLCVDSVIDCMVRAACARRRTMADTTVIAITGSAGKTTTTRLLHSVLAQSTRGSASAKSHNNTLGLCLTLLNARPDDRYLISELGTSAPGEIAALCEILRPTIGVVTSIGRAHAQGLGSIDQIATEKATLLNSLGADGVALIPADCPAIEAALHTPARVVRVGQSTDADISISDATMDASGVHFRVNGSAFDLRLLGTHNAQNAAFAVAVGRTLGLDDGSIKRGLRLAEPPTMRLQLEHVAGITILNDAYNANPESMLAAIDTLEAIGHSGRKIAVLADMLELGDLSTQSHQEIGSRLSSATLDRVFLVGPAMRDGLAILNETPIIATHIEDPKDLEPIARELRRGDLVLIKGSRSMRMERLIELLHDRTDLALTEPHHVHIPTRRAMPRAT